VGKLKFGELDHITLQIFHQFIVEAVAFQQLEGVVSCADGLELETILTLIEVYNPTTHQITHGYRRTA
jgi:hypothetical protein